MNDDRTIHRAQVKLDARGDDKFLTGSIIIDGETSFPFVIDKKGEPGTIQGARLTTKDLDRHSVYTETYVNMCISVKLQGMVEGRKSIEYVYGRRPF